MMEEKYTYFHEQGILFLEAEIDEGTASVFCLEVLHAHKMLPKHMPLWIVLNSPGGYVHHGLGVFDTIKMVTAQGRVVNILGIGLVASMATVILQGGTRRFSLPNTQFLLHQISETIIFKREEVSEGEDRIEEAKRLNDVVIGIISARSGMDHAELKKLCRKTDFWLDPEKARNLGTSGLVDEIISSLPF